MKPNPTKCPLCGKPNHCGMTSTESANPSCWCMNSDITFPDSLLTQVTDQAKNKVCICRECALKHREKNIDASVVLSVPV
jgi:hypothetical protein